MRKYIRILLFSSLTLLLPQSLLAQPSAADDFINEASSALLETSSIGDADERLTRLSSAIDQYFDLSLVALGVVGNHRDALSAEQMLEFEVEFQKALVGLMFAALEEIGSYELLVEEPRMRDENRAQVLALIETASQGDLEFLFSLVRSENAWNVANLIISGVNLGLTYRNQFNELMLSNEGNADLAITAWAETLSTAR